MTFAYALIPSRLKQAMASPIRIFRRSPSAAIPPSYDPCRLMIHAGLWSMQADAPCSTGSRHIFLLVRLLRPIKQAPWQPPQFLFINALNMVRVHIFPCLNYNIWCVYTATDREGDGNRCGIKMRMLYFCKLIISLQQNWNWMEIWYDLQCNKWIDCFH